MRINWFSNAPWAATGYGNQTRLFTPRLRALGHDMTITAFYGLEGAIINWNGIPVYPRWAHNYGLDIIGANAAHFNSDIVITLIDAWIFDSAQLQAQHVKWCPWFPVDCEQLPLSVERQVKQALQPMVYSKHALRLCEAAGLDVMYVPHGIDAKVFVPRDKQQAREKMKLPTDRFIVGMIAANKDPGDRKAFFQQIEAFARLHRQHPDTFLYMHTQQSQERGGFSALNLREFAEQHGLIEGEDFTFCDQYAYIVGFSDDYMVNAYNSFDVLLSVSKGEGFGIPIVEAQACGTPVIVGDWSAMGELCFDGWKVYKNEADPVWNPQGAYMMTPRVGAIEDRLLRAYRAAGKTHQDALQGAQLYDADLVTETYWKPALQRITERLGVEAEKPEPSVEIIQ